MLLYLTVKSDVKSSSEVILSDEQEQPLENLKGLRFNVPLYDKINEDIVVGNKQIHLTLKKLCLKLKKGTVIKTHDNFFFKITLWWCSSFS